MTKKMAVHLFPVSSGRYAASRSTRAGWSCCSAARPCSPSSTIRPGAATACRPCCGCAWTACTPYGGCPLLAFFLGRFPAPPSQFRPSAGLGRDLSALESL